MDWAVAVTTAPRPQPTLRQTLASLRWAGWPKCEVVADPRKAGSWPTWLRALSKLLNEYPAADAYMTVQDDAVFCPELREYLEANLWPPGEVALCSPYCPTPYRSASGGWHAEDRGWYLVGAVCWVIPAAAACSIVAELGSMQATSRIDARIGRWARETGRGVWYHSPSLVQHVGNGNSAMGDPLVNSLRRAADFIGQDTRPQRPPQKPARGPARSPLRKAREPNSAWSGDRGDLTQPPAGEEPRE